MTSFHQTILCGFLLLFLTAIAPALASSPGMGEGPPGCSWNGTVVEMGEANAAVRLDTLHGNCMYEPGPCGKEGDIVTVEFELSNEVSKGKILKVWVTAGDAGDISATLTQPVCTKTPIPPEK